MSDADRCRATAARYGRIAALSDDVEVRRAYLELERLWLEAATWTARLNLAGDDNVKKRVYEVIERAGLQNRELDRIQRDRPAHQFH